MYYFTPSVDQLDCPKGSDMAFVTVHDETTLGESTGELTLEFLTERVTVREIIRSRVYQEVTEYNARQAGLFRGLVQPRDAEWTREGFNLRTPRRIDWAEQYEAALASYAKNGFLLLVDYVQVTDLDAEIELRHDTRVSFLRLVPLVGG
jgi:hypothetical protein